MEIKTTELRVNSLKYEKDMILKESVRNDQKKQIQLWNEQSLAKKVQKITD